jgi:hypothetical protein
MKNRIATLYGSTACISGGVCADPLKILIVERQGAITRQYESSILPAFFTTGEGV